MADCQHLQFSAEVGVHRLTDGDDGPVLNYVAEVKVSCAGCGLPFHFLGPPTGYAFRWPTVDMPATTLHAPLTPGERQLRDIPDRIAFEVGKS
jgi:hypothetical protein